MNLNLDLTSIETKTYDVIPEGDYHGTMTSCEIKQDKGNNDCINYTFTLTNGRKVFGNFYIKSANEKSRNINLQKLKSYLNACGRSPVINHITDIIGGFCKVTIEHNTFNGKTKAEIKYFKKAEIEAPKVEDIFA